MNSAFSSGSRPILIISGRDDYTTDYVILRLKERGIPFVRFNTEDFPNTVSSTFRAGGDSGCGWEIASAKWSLKDDQVGGVWYRRPGRCCPDQFGLDAPDARWAERECEALLRGMWEVCGAPIVSLPSAIRRAEEKPLQLALAQHIGMSLPTTVITNDPSEIRSKLKQSGKWILKPLWSGSYQVDSHEAAIFCNVFGERDRDFSDDEIRCAPFILQEQIPKVADARVTFFGEKAFTFKITPRSEADGVIDWRTVPSEGLRYEPYDLPAPIDTMCRKMLTALDLRFGAFDFALCENGDHVFLEVNPNGQWVWLELETDVDMTSALVNLLRAEHE